ncbi:MAG: hypothetical protein ACLQUY_03325 [Ktedonobacterales bacterium]
MTVFGQPTFQFLHPADQQHDLLTQQRYYPHLLAHRGVLGFQFGKAFFERHARVLH